MSSCDHASSDGIRRSRATSTLTISRHRAPALARSPYSFYAAFAADEEFRVMDGMKMLGTLPVSQLLREGQRILFAARTWKVTAIDK